MTISIESRCWTWKRRRRWTWWLLALWAVLAVGVINSEIVALEPAYDCANGRGHDPVISITLNGGPNEWTTKILKILRAANAFATFFVEPDLFISSTTLQQVLKEIVADGHTVACHASGTKENTACLAQLAQIIGYHPVLRRPLSLDDVAGEVSDARSNGQVVALWNYDFGDWDSSKSEPMLVQQYKETLVSSMNRSIDSGSGITKRYGSFIVVMQNGDRIVRSFTMPNGLRTTILEQVLSGSQPYSFVSIVDCLKVKAYSAYSTPDQPVAGSTTSNTVLFAIVFAGLFGLLAIAAVLYTSARRKLHEKARQKEQQRELSRAAIGVMVSQGLFKGDRRDFEQSIPENSEDLESNNSQHVRHLTPTGTVRTPPMKRTKKDFHDLKSSHYSMAVNPHGRTDKKRNKPTRIVYNNQRLTPEANPKQRTRSAAMRRHPLRRNSDPIFGSEDDEIFMEDMAPTHPAPPADDRNSSGVYRPPVRAVPVVLPFQQPFDYVANHEHRRRSVRALSSGSITGSGRWLGRRKRILDDSDIDDDDDGLDADFRQDFVGSPFIKTSFK